MATRMHKLGLALGAGLLVFLWAGRGKGAPDERMAPLGEESLAGPSGLPPVSSSPSAVPQESPVRLLAPEIPERMYSSWHASTSQDPVTAAVLPPAATPLSTEPDPAPVVSIDRAAPAAPLFYDSSESQPLPAALRAPESLPADVASAYQSTLGKAARQLPGRW